VPHYRLTFLHVATDFGSRPGVGFDESAPGQNRRRNAFGPEKRMRLNLHGSAQAEVVVLGDYTFQCRTARIGSIGSQRAARASSFATPDKSILTLNRARATFVR